jgi:hypothetical protein
MSMLRSLWVSVSSAGGHNAIAFAVAELRDHASWLPWRRPWFSYDFDAARLEFLNGDLDVAVNQYEDRTRRWRFVPAPQEVEGGCGARKSELDPSPAIIAHGLVGDDTAIQMIDAESL